MCIFFWDSRTQYENDQIEKIQYEAAKIVTGLTKSVSINNLLKEVGWVPLSDRRKIQKYVFIYKEKHGLLPEYLHELFPGTVQEISDNQYALRNNESYASDARWTKVYAISVIPSLLSLWDNLDANIRSAESLNAFKNKLKLLYQPPTVPYYFKTGERFVVVHHTRIRNNLGQSPMCDCGVEIENAEHYFSDADGTVINVCNFLLILVRSIL